MKGEGGGEEKARTAATRTLLLSPILFPASAYERRSEKGRGPKGEVAVFPLT